MSDFAKHLQNTGHAQKNRCRAYFACLLHNSNLVPKNRLQTCQNDSTGQKETNQKSIRTAIEKINKKLLKFEPEAAFGQIYARMRPKSISETTQRRPKSHPKRAQGVQGASQSVSGSPESVPITTQEHSKMHPNAHKRPKTLWGPMWNRFGTQNGSYTSILQAGMNAP